MVNEQPTTAHELVDYIATLQTRLAELESRLPAHSIPPALIGELDALDEQIEAAQVRLAAWAEKAKAANG